MANESNTPIRMRKVSGHFNTLAEFRDSKGYKDLENAVKEFTGMIILDSDILNNEGYVQITYANKELVHEFTEHTKKYPHLFDQAVYTVVDFTKETHPF